VSNHQSLFCMAYKKIKLPDLPPNWDDSDVVDSLLKELSSPNVRKERKEVILEALAKKGIGV